MARVKKKSERKRKGDKAAQLKARIKKYTHEQKRYKKPRIAMQKL